MKRFLTSIATFSFVEVIGRHPAIAAGVLTLLGVGGGVGIALLNTPLPVPLVSSNFNSSSSQGTTTNGLRLNAGVANAMMFPSTPTNSFTIYGELGVNQNLAYGNTEQAFLGLTLLGNPGNNPGQPFFSLTKTVAGNETQWWRGNSAVNTTFGTLGVTGSPTNYAVGMYPFTATGSGCGRDPTGVMSFVSTHAVSVDPGFLCPSTTPNISVAIPSIPGVAAQQSTGAGGNTTTCTVINSQAVVTATMAIAHGLSPGLKFSLQGFTPAGFNSTTYTALPGTTGAVLVGTTGAGSCPAASASVEGTALLGLNGSITFPTISATLPFGPTGIATRNGQKICAAIGEYGDDSPFPGAQFVAMTDESGVALVGSPALVPWLNQGTATNFSSTTTNGSTTMTVSAMNTTAITGASFNNTTGFATFVVGAAQGFMPGSEFTVAGMTPSGYNGTYVALGGTTQASTSILANHLSGPGGVPAVMTNPGAATGFGTLKSVLLPGMAVLGTTGNTAAAFILPYGSLGTTGTGGTGTYALNASQTASNTPVFAWAATYYSAAAGGAGGGTVTARTQATIGDFTNLLGTNSAIIFGNKSGWGGSLGNFAMLWASGGSGYFPMTTGGQPSLTALSSVCKKTVSVPAFAAANNMTVRSYYPLSDLGIWGDHSDADITGYITNSPGPNNATLNVVSTPQGSLALATGTQIANLTGAGLPVASPVTIPLTTSAVSTYAITPNTTPALGSIGSPVPLAVGQWKPATPLAATTVTATIAADVLSVTSLDNTSHAGFGSFTGQLNSAFTAGISPSPSGGVAAGHSLVTVTLPIAITSTGVAQIGVGTTVINAGSTLGTIVQQLTSTATSGILGASGTYDMLGTATVTAGTAMLGGGILPSGPTTLTTSALTGTLQTGFFVTDGGANITTGNPILITGGGGTSWAVAPNYYPSVAPEAMTASLSVIVPGQYLQGTGITTPVKVLSYQGPCGITGAFNGGPGCYKLSNSLASGFSGTLTGTTISDGGAIAPGPALTILDQGPGAIFAEVGGLGKLYLSGTYDVPTLGGTPSGIQVLVSTTAGGAPLAGCAPCNWGALTGTISAGIWSGTISGIPAGGPYLVSVRSANGQAYATMPSSVRVGQINSLHGQGQAGGFSTAGPNTAFFRGLPGVNVNKSPFTVGGVDSFFTTPFPSGFFPARTVAIGGDADGIGSGGIPFTEGIVTLEQGLENVSGFPQSFIDNTHDGVGITLQTLGNTAQTQSVARGNGSITSFCSASAFCPSAGVSLAGPLYANFGILTGATLAGATVTSGGVLNVPTSTGLVQGALSPGMVLTDASGFIGTVQYCTLGCSIAYHPSSGPLQQQWQTTYSGAGISTPEAMRAEPATGPAPWSIYNPQWSGLPVPIQGFGTSIIKAGTFKITDDTTGLVLCQDTQAFVYNGTGGNCTGAGISSSFVNYQTGDYQITFASAPASGDILTASWTSIVAPGDITTNLARGQGIDYFGDGTSTSGHVSQVYSSAPGGVTGFVASGCSVDEGNFLNSGPSAGYAFGAPGYAQEFSWLYGSKFPSVIPGVSPTTPVIVSLQYRSEGPSFFNVATSPNLDLCDGIGEDISTPSSFSGTVTSGGATLTLTSAATGPMWEGEVIGCAPFSLSCPMVLGTQIQNLVSGAWGASGSTYSLNQNGCKSTPTPPLACTGIPMQNAVLYSGGGPVIYAGTLNDISVQQLNGLAGFTSASVHMAIGPNGTRRQGARLAAAISGAIPPSLSRANDSASGTPSPAFDYTNTYAVTATPTGISGANLTFNGLAANTRPIVVGHAVTCAGCAAGLYVKAIDHPPTQDTGTGQGQIGAFNNGFVVTLNAAPGASGAFTFGCTSGSGGSNCINFDFNINSGGTYGTPAALATCGENNFNGTAPSFVPPQGICLDNGVGELVTGFRIGTQQNMYGGASFTGSVFSDGAEFFGGAFHVDQAFTCNLVAGKTVQCVHGPAFTSGLPSGVGKWVSGSTFTNYGDMTLATARVGAVYGYVGGQSFPIANGGTGVSNATAVQATCPTIVGGGHAPYFDVKTSGGVVVGVYPSITSAALATQAPGLGVGGPGLCTVVPPTGSGTSISIPFTPNEGAGGVAAGSTDNNSLGILLYDNSGFVGNPYHSFFDNGTGGEFEPGMPLRPFGEILGVAVSG